MVVRRHFYIQVYVYIHVHVYVFTSLVYHIEIYEGLSETCIFIYIITSVSVCNSLLFKINEG